MTHAALRMWWEDFYWVRACVCGSDVVRVTATPLANEAFDLARRPRRLVSHLAVFLRFGNLRRTCGLVSAGVNV